MIEEKGLGNKKIVRRSVSLSNEYDSKLMKLATACRMKPASLASLLLETCLDDISLINKLQNEYCTEKAYKIRPVNHNGKIMYTLTGRDDL
jgi:hypothetical protein